MAPAREFNSKMKFHVRADGWRDYIEVAIAMRHADGRLSLVRDVTFQDVEEGTFFTESPFEFTPEEAAGLMTAMWECGIRPKYVIHKDETLSAMRGHLEDMRALVAAKLKVRLP